jgi:Domain of unknown function (DUF4190)
VTTPPEQPFRGTEYQPLEDRPGPPDPYAPVDYPTGYPPLPPPTYPHPVAGYPGGYPGYGANPYDPYRQGKPQGTNGLAIAALVISLVSLLFCGFTSIIGLILGLIAMRDTKRSGQDGFGIALAGTIIGAVPIVLWALYWLFFVVIFASGFQWAP